MGIIDTAVIGALGGKARAKNMTPKERTDSARRAAEIRWAKKKRVGKKAKKAK